MGCGVSYENTDEKMVEYNRFYSIINLAKATVIQKGEMNELRDYYGLVKMDDMYYAILGCCGDLDNPSHSVDIFNHKTG